MQSWRFLINKYLYIYLKGWMMGGRERESERYVVIDSTWMATASRDRKVRTKSQELCLDVPCSKNPSNLVFRYFLPECFNSKLNGKHRVTKTLSSTAIWCVGGLTHCAKILILKINILIWTLLPQYRPIYHPLWAIFEI